MFFLFLFSVARYAPKPFVFDFGMIRGVFFDPGGGPKEKKYCPFYKNVLFEVPGSSGVPFWNILWCFVVAFDVFLVTVSSETRVSENHPDKNT